MSTEEQAPVAGQSHGGTAATRPSRRSPASSAGLLFVILVPGIYAGLLSVLVETETAEEAVPAGAGHARHPDPR